MTDTQTETENQDSTSEQTEPKEERYLKLAATPNKGDNVVVRLRLLDYPGVSVFRHWIGEGDTKYPYNCPGRRGNCPACAERALAKIRGDEYRQIHRMDHRSVVNLLDLTTPDDPKLKVYSLGPAVEKRLKGTIERGEKYADPTTYDISISKRKTGPEKFDVEYDVFYEEHRALTALEEALASNKHDLVPETTPASVEAIGAAMKGERPTSSRASSEQRAAVDKVLKAQGLSFLDIRVSDPDAMSSAKAEEILRDLG